LPVSFSTPCRRTAGLSYFDHPNVFASILPPVLAPQQGTGWIGTEDVEERRKSPRDLIEEPAYISSGGSVIGCVLRNISTEGAAIDVENAAFVPARFRLIIARDNSVHECAISWIQQNRIGLTFVAPPETSS
jgi:hypothetical protein